MGADSLIDENDPFWDDMEDVLIICVKKDRTVNLKTSIQDMEDLMGVFTTLYMMAMFRHMKSSPPDLDIMH
jgi:hypothetical protein